MFCGGGAHAGVFAQCILMRLKGLLHDGHIVTLVDVAMIAIVGVFGVVISALLVSLISSRR